MDVTQSTSEKRSIRVKDFLTDFRSASTDGELMKKYHLSPAGLEKFYTMLLERKILSAQEFEARRRPVEDEQPEEDSERSTYFCPSCLETLETMVDFCPSCGASLRPFLEEQFSAPEQEPRAESYPHSSEHAAHRHAHGHQPPAPPSHHSSRNPGIDRPIEIPMEGLPDEEYRTEANETDQRAGLFDSDDLHGAHDLYGQTSGEGADRMPFDFDELQGALHADPAAKCRQCEEDLHPGVRKIYDRKRGLMAAVISGILLVLGLLGALTLTFFEGYSLLRLAVIYGTGISLLLGTVMVGTAVFMLFLARERVYACMGCGRVYPRV